MSSVYWLDEFSGMWFVVWSRGRKIRVRNWGFV